MWPSARELGEPRFARLAVVAAPVGGEGMAAGSVGVIGPSRMDYARVIPLVGYVSHLTQRSARRVSRANDPKTDRGLGGAGGGVSGGALTPSAELEEALREAEAAVEARAGRRARERGRERARPEENASSPALAGGEGPARGALRPAPADFDNYRKRKLREKQEALRYGHENLVKDLLAVVDNLERAIEHARRAPARTSRACCRASSSCSASSSGSSPSTG